MKQLCRQITLMVAVLSSVVAPVIAIAADTAISTLNVSGNVPVVFSITTRGLPGDLDLTPGVDVNDRLLGLIHFKYNKDIANLNIKSDTTTGKPEDGGTAYSFGAGGFNLKFGTCASVGATWESNFTISNTDTDIKDGTALTAGVEEDCSLMASWDGTTSALPLAGKYSMVITLTMISN